MGIRIKNNSGARVATTLTKICDRSTRELRRVHRDAAMKIAEVAEQMAPFKTGQLEGSIDVEESAGVDRRKVFTVSASAINDGFDYAPAMHEGEYNLGPGSERKQSKSNFTVGRKYLSRAVDWIIDVWDLPGRARRAVRNGRR